MAKMLDGADPHALETAATALRAGELVAFPTETVYGLGADALNERAVAQVFAVKNRPHFDPLIVHLPNHASARVYAIDIDYRAVALMERFWPGPLTLVLRKKPIIPDIVTAGLDSVALRVPAHPVALALLRALGKPIAAPSANPFGYVSPTTATHVQETLGDKIKLILDGGPCRVGVESTVCALTEKEAVILRPGGVTVEEIEAAIGPVQVASGRADARSPGTLPRHYAPYVNLQLLAHGASFPRPQAGERVGALVFTKRQDLQGYAAVEVLSQEGNLIEAAANLFAALRKLDSLQLDRVLIESVPEHGLGRAIMDRLRRAAARSWSG
ncbi:MAG TPA: L-threonylcarbamoyladenylate synthase [Methylomirabilota bacterium]|jgi:L-threonylcarbamoyladenylate synthase|nr:L-threonylcarbamoyladenylate synthase [Methylomirabilota bacterium]